MPSINLWYFDISTAPEWRYHVMVKQPSLQWSGDLLPTSICNYCNPLDPGKLPGKGF